jgi:hypothetical protein
MAISPPDYKQNLLDKHSSNAGSLHNSEIQQLIAGEWEAK